MKQPEGAMTTATPSASNHAEEQYQKTSSNLDARLAILDYDTSPLRWHVWLGTRLPLNGKILEVGAGTGELWKHIDYSKAESVTLTDFSEAMVERLKEQAEIIGEKVSEVQVQQCNAAALPFKDSTFDLVIANHMLYHLDDPSAALAEFARVLKPGGTVCTALNGSNHIAQLLELGKAIDRPSKIVSASKITAESAPELLRNYFIDVGSERFPGAFDCPTAKPVIGYLGSWADEPMTAEQGAKAKEKIEIVIQAKGSFVIRKEMFLLRGTKA